MLYVFPMCDVERCASYFHRVKKYFESLHAEHYEYFSEKGKCRRC